MRKQSFLLQVFVAAALLLTACQKQDAHRPDPHQQTIAKVNDWLNDQDAAANNTVIGQLKENLDYTKLRFEELREGERFIIVPLKPGFQSRNNTGKHPVSALLLIENKTGAIRMGNIAQYIPLTPQANATIPVNSFVNIFNAESPGVDAQFSFLTLGDRLAYQVMYRGGVLQSSATAQTGSTAVNSPPQAPISDQPTCTDWYLLTTYYYEDGHTEQTVEYLYTICEPSGGGGSATGNDVEYEFEKYKLAEWVVYHFPGTVYDIYSWENIKGRKVAGDTHGGRFTHSSHHGDQCNNGNGLWIATDWDVHHSDYEAYSKIIGQFSYHNGSSFWIEKEKSWAFEDLFRK